jgi:hypothetical protein
METHINPYMLATYLEKLGESSRPVDHQMVLQTGCILLSREGADVFVTNLQPPLWKSDN